MYINKAMIAGNLTRDPEMKSLPSGNKVVNFSLATNRTWKDQNGVKQEAVEYLNVTAYDKQAEVIAQYMRKGSAIFVEGRLQTRSWEAEGKKNYRTEIIVENFQFMGSGTGKSGSDGAAAQTPLSQSPADEAAGYDVVEYPNDDINPEDIPF